MIRSTVAVLIALCLGPAVAANIDPRLAKADTCGRYEIFHINGIQTTETDANRNLDRLTVAYGNAHNEHLIAYRLAYNPTQGALLDLVDVFAQKLNEYPGATFSMIVRAFLGRVRDPLPVSLADELQRILIERIRSTGYVSLNDADLAAVVDRIRRQRLSGAKTLLVPHSQGNLYANSAYTLLTQAAGNPVPPKSLAIVGVASPAAFVAGANGRYVTSRQDLVIFGLRKLLGNGNVLPGNVTQPLTLDDPLGHSFQAIYLRPNTNARTKLLGDIATAFDALRTDQSYGSYVVSVHLNWTPPIPARLSSCAVPARLYWFEDPDYLEGGGSAGLRAVDAERSALEARGEAIAMARYAAGLGIWRDFAVSRGPFDPLPRGGTSAWHVYSADSQRMGYSIAERGPYWMEVVMCSDGTRRGPTEIVGGVYGQAYVSGQCTN